MSYMDCIYDFLHLPRLLGDPYPAIGAVEPNGFHHQLTHLTARDDRSSGIYIYICIYIYI